MADRERELKEKLSVSEKEQQNLREQHYASERETARLKNALQNKEIELITAQTSRFEVENKELREQIVALKESREQALEKLKQENAFEVRKNTDMRRILEEKSSELERALAQSNSEKLRIREEAEKLMETLLGEVNTQISNSFKISEVFAHGSGSAYEFQGSPDARGSPVREQQKSKALTSLQFK